MATGVQILKSTDASAPVLHGNNGDLVALLDAVLINGYGAKSAIGTGGAGAWATTFTASNKRVYRPSAGNRFYMRIRDDGGGSGGAKEATFKGASAFTDVDTVSTDPFPAVAQSALTDNATIIRKSATADNTTARPWIAVGDDRTLMLFIASETDTVFGGYYFGDFNSYLAGDAYRTLICGRGVENNASQSNSPLHQLQTGFSQESGRSFTTRSHLGTGTSVCVGKHSDYVKTLGNMGAGAPMGFPNGPDGDYYFAPCWLHDSNTAGGDHVRGTLRGIWVGCFPATNVSHGDTFSGTGSLASRTLQIIKISADGSGFYVVETTDTWDTSS